MSRSGYSTELDPLTLGRWRGAVMSTIRGKKGQAFLKELLAALDAMPEKYLVANSLIEEAVNDDDTTETAAVCTLGALGQKRCMDLKKLDPEDYDAVAEAFGVNPKLVQEIVFENDEQFSIVRLHVPDPVTGRLWRRETGYERWIRMRAWVARQIKQDS